MRLENYIYIIVLLFWPFVVIDKSIFFVATIVLFLLVLFRNNKLKINRIMQLLFIIVVVHLLSIVEFLLIKGSDFPRTVAAINTALCWFNAGIAYTIICSGDKKNIFIKEKKLSKYSVMNLCILVGLTLFAIAMIQKGQNVTLMGNSLILPDWTGDRLTYRTSLFMEYCSLITCFVIINISLILRCKIDKKGLLLMLICFLPVYYSKSRICVLAYIVYMGIVFGEYIKEKTRYFKVITFIMIVFALMLVLFGDVYEVLYDILYARSNSTLRRLEIYSLSIKNMWETNPIIGCGIKTIYRDGIPFGSHSTYIGILYKIGLLGLGLSLLLIKEICLVIKRKGNLVDWAAFFAFSIIMMLEDADGTNWLVFYMFVYLGIIRITGNRIQARRDEDESLPNIGNYTNL